jgi:hypothetical protein
MDPDVFITIVLCLFVALAATSMSAVLLISSGQRQTETASDGVPAAGLRARFSKNRECVLATKDEAGTSLDPLGLRINPQRPAVAPDSDPRLLVIADEHCESPALWQEIYARLSGAVAVHVVVPVRVSHLHYLTNDEKVESDAAEDRLRLVVRLLRERGVSVTGGVGTDDPLESMTDALASFPATRILLATTTEDDSYWMEQGLLTKARSLTPLEVRQVVVPSTPTGRNGRSPVWR